MASYLNTDMALSNNSYVRNLAGIDGGACWFYLMHADIIVADSSFEENIAKRGAIFLGINNKDIVLRGLDFKDNRMNEGAVYIDNGNTNIEISHCTFSDNKALNAGAGIFMYYGNTFVDIDNCHFLNNVAMTGYAGALSLETLHSNVSTHCPHLLFY